MWTRVAVGDGKARVAATALSAGAMAKVSRLVDAPSSVQELAAKYGGGGKVAPSWVEDEESVFIADWDAYDGEKREAFIYPCGKYRYVTVLGAEKTVLRFTLSPDEAALHLFADRGINAPESLLKDVLKPAPLARAEADIAYQVWAGSESVALQFVRTGTNGGAALIYWSQTDSHDVWIVDVPPLVNNKWSGIVYPCGEYTYANSGRKVRRYATTMKTALAALKADQEKASASK